MFEKKIFACWILVPATIIGMVMGKVVNDQLLENDSSNVVELRFPEEYPDLEGCDFFIDDSKRSSDDDHVGFIVEVSCPANIG